MVSRRAGCSSCLSGVFVLVIGSVGLAAYLRSTPYRQWLTAIPGLASVLPPAVTAEVSQVADRGVAIDYFADATPVLQAYEQRLGSPVHATQLIVYATYAVLYAQDPKNLSNVDSYTLMRGAVESVTPVPVNGNPAKLEHLLFKLEDVNLSLLPGLVKSAALTLAITDSKPSHVIIERDSFGAKQPPAIRVYVGGPRGSGYVEYSLSGKQQRVVK